MERMPHPGSRNEDRARILHLEIGFIGDYFRLFRPPPFEIFIDGTGQESQEFFTRNEVAPTIGGGEEVF